MSKNQHHFRGKKAWSKVKDSLLRCYLAPYFAKILKTRKITYIDCFAGQGMFEDKKQGSPLIALDVIGNSLEQSKYKENDVRFYFIEKKYATELGNNIASHAYKHLVTVKKGGFLEEINGILKDNQNRSLFLYIDPFGIKDLSFKLFDELSESNRSIELLINFNAFGFLRDACRVMKLSKELILELESVMEADDLDEETEESIIKDEEATLKAVMKLNNIAGGEYWKNIIEDYKNGKIDFRKAEKTLAEKYRERFKTKYKYVIDLPIKNKQRNAPKYRMVHVTNHEEGCFLMYQNISGRWDELTLLHAGGQLSLLEQNHSDYSYDKEQVKASFLEHINSLDKGTSLNRIYATFCSQKGVLCKFGELQNFVKDFEKNNKIVLIREPKHTKNGTESTFLYCRDNQKVTLG